MPRAERLLALLETLRSYRYPVPGATLAARCGVSLRTLYRDIAVLQGLGARIEGEAGVGYVLRPGFTLPPLAFTDDELDALLLGARWVADRGDGALGEAARRAVAKIGAVLPAERRVAIEDPSLLVRPGGRCDGARAAAVRAARIETGERDDAPVPHADASPDLATLRTAIRRERRVRLDYRDLSDRTSTRTVWPIALVYLDRVQLLVAWCELREGFRHFRPDRIAALAPLAGRYPRRRHVLLAEWRAAEETGAAGGDPLAARPA